MWLLGASLGVLLVMWISNVRFLNNVVRQDLAAVRGDFVSLRDEMTAMREELTSMRQDLTGFRHAFDHKTGELEKEARLIRESLGELKGLERRVAAHEKHSGA